MSFQRHEFQNRVIYFEIGVSVTIKKVNSLFNQHFVSIAFLAKAVLFNKKTDYFFVGVHLA
jgi:hypothetical protein